MRTPVFYIITCLIAASVPFFWIVQDSGDDAATFPGWPEQFDGMPLHELPLSVRERQLMQGFSGRIARFTDGDREIIVRWTSRISQTFQSASDGFRRLGYAFQHEPFWKQIWRDQHGRRWGYFTTESPENLQVMERIYDDAGHQWTDVSAWYWAALLRKTVGPWWIVMTVKEQG
jgi:hypothetical protein